MSAAPATVLARLLLAAAAFLLLSLAGPLARLACRWWPVEGADARASIETGVGAFGAACLLVTVLALLRRPVPAWRPAAPRAVLARYLPFFCAWVLFLVAYLRVMHGIGSTVPPQYMLEYLRQPEPARPGFWVVVATMVLLGPLAEEIVFRGFVQDTADAVLPRWPAIVLTAALFGAVHGWDYALPIGVLGILFGWLRHRHGSLLAPYVAHVTHNAIGVVTVCAWPGILDLLYPS